MSLSGLAPKGARVLWIARSYKYLAPNGAKTADRTAFWNLHLDDGNEHLGNQ
jgi:hypothetical protein